MKKLSAKQIFCSIRRNLPPVYRLLLLSFFLCLAFATLSMAADNVCDIDAGTWASNPRYITFGGYNGHPLVWRVLEVKDNDLDFNGVKTALLLLDDLLRDKDGNVEMTGFDQSNNNFPNSRIKEWLNDGVAGFLSGLGAYQSDILDTTYGPGNASRKWYGRVVNGASKVFLLSVGEAENKNYFADNAGRVVSNKNWWLRSPGFGGGNIAAIVLNIGDVIRNGFYVDNICAVRPALKINLSPSSIFASLPVSYGLSVKADDGNNPIPGAKVSLFLSPAARNAESFSNSTGEAYFSNVMPGTYTITGSKPGYTTTLETITVPPLHP